MRDPCEHFRSEAEALRPDELQPIGFDLATFSRALGAGIAAIERIEPCVGAPRLRLLCEALNEATNRVAAARPKMGATRELITEVYADRKVLMAMLLSWVNAGLVPRAELRQRSEGPGPVDAADDVVSIVCMLRSHPATVGRLLLQSAELDVMVGRAEALVDLLMPSNGALQLRLERARDLQTRLWTLLLAEHELLRHQGARLFGNRVDEWVPPLRSRVQRKRTAYGAPHESSDPAPA